MKYLVSKKENSEQKTVIADQAARLNTLEAENERQRQELVETKQGLEDLRAAVSQLLASKGLIIDSLYQKSWANIKVYAK